MKVLYSQIIRGSSPINYNTTTSTLTVPCLKHSIRQQEGALEYAQVTSRYELQG